MSRDKIVIKGARQHNLKNIDLELPRDKMIVMTGLSGSGKSSLAFDTIYAEGQRRYVESLSSYARQFLGQMDKPDVDYIEGLSPAISIDQKTTSKNPRSTVATVTEVYDYMRLLWARIGHPHCPKCGKAITQQTVEQIVDHVMGMDEGSRIQILAPVIRGRKGEHKKVFDDIRREGFVRVRVNGEVRDLSDGDIELEKYKNHSIDIVVDRIIVRPDSVQRLSDSIETALKHGGGLAIVNIVGGEDTTFSENFACPDCGISFEELVPRMFSFNSPFGACQTCAGLGTTQEIDVSLVLDKGKPPLEGGLIPLANTSSYYYFQLLTSMAADRNLDMTRPIEAMSEADVSTLLFGTGPDTLYAFEYTNMMGQTKTHKQPYEGLLPLMQRRYRETQSDGAREEYERYMRVTPCPDCKGLRLKPESLAVTVGGVSIAKASSLPVGDCSDFFSSLKLTNKETLIAKQILKEIHARLGFLLNVGLDYLTLDRAAGTLSGGEAQRIRLATQIGSSLVGVLYILDEPSIGLHQRDNQKLVGTLKGLRDAGNTLIIVEHDEDTMREADYLVDIGPAAGAHGGEVVAAGTLEEVMACSESITGQYLSGAMRIPVPERRVAPSGKWVEVKGARENNLKGIDAAFPIGCFVCVTGVSGSGKSTLVNEILHKRLARDLNGAHTQPGDHDAILGLQYLDKVIDIDQSPIGRTPRSNSATYTGVFDIIREVFGQTSESKVRGYAAGRFSFNVKGGRCEACKGDGIIKIEMHFLPDVYVPCEVCKGRRYNRETLDIKYKGKTIADVLDMRVEDAVEFFTHIPRIRRKMETLNDVGLGYVTLGQPATTLSGGEAQRVKLAAELSRRSNGKTLYILDEPTTGLHFHDTARLLEVLLRLRDAGDTVVVIEHNLDVIKTADYVIDLGPEGGHRGGAIVAVGTPEEVAEVEASHTGHFLKRSLEQRAALPEVALR